MKQLKVFIPVLLFFLLVGSVQILKGQLECKVLIPGLSGSYKGKCKNGLADGKGEAKGIDTYSGSFKQGLPHGKGKYVWSSGDVYEGEWKDGLRDGIGTYTFTVNDKDSVLSGLWEDDKYKGPPPAKPKVTRKYNIDNVSFFRQGDGDRVEISFYQAGAQVSDLQSLIIVGNTGAEYFVGKVVGFQNVIFPFVCTIRYSIWNPFHTEIFDCSLEFEIQQPGHWIVKVDNI